MGAKRFDAFPGAEEVGPTSSGASPKVRDVGTSENARSALAHARSKGRNVVSQDLRDVGLGHSVVEPNAHVVGASLRVVEPSRHVKTSFDGTLGFDRSVRFQLDESKSPTPTAGAHRAEPTLPTVVPGGRHVPMRLACVVFAFAAAAASPTLAHAKPHGRHGAAHRGRASYFLAGDPHVPLAVVMDGRTVGVHTSAKSPCGRKSRWGIIGSRWRAIDTWGQDRGVYLAQASDDYDVTGCSELSFAPALANDARYLFVSEASPWRAAPSSEWRPSVGEWAQLRSLAGTPPSGPAFAQCAELATDALAFRVVRAVGAVDHYAVLGGADGYVIARQDAAWSIVNTWRQPVRGRGQCFRPVAVFDMNGDGKPEIVMRFSGGDGWQDFVLSESASGSWESVAVSPGGSTA
jgi:hypothetical protein